MKPVLISHAPKLHLFDRLELAGPQTVEAGRLLGLVSMRAFLRVWAYVNGFRVRGNMDLQCRYEVVWAKLGFRWAL